MTIVVENSIREHGDRIYITTPVDLYVPEQEEIDTFAFAQDLKSVAPNPKIMWMRGQYVEADKPNRNDDRWTAGELAIKALTPVLMPVTVMHDLRSAVGTIADARLFTPEKDSVPRARIDTTLAVWAHRFPEVAAECQANAKQGTLMQSMECLSAYYDCSVCGVRMRRQAGWQKEWQAHTATHADAIANDGRSPARTLVSVTFTGVGLIFGTRGARGAMPDAHLEVEELAAMHREAHESTCTAPKRARRKNTVDIEDSKYEALVAARSEADSRVTDLTAQVAAKDKQIETLEADKVKAEEARDTEKKRADKAEEDQRVAAMRDERVGAFGTKFRAKLDKLETTKANLTKQAATFSDEEWEARVSELEEGWEIKRDADLDAKDDKPEGDKPDKDKDPEGLFSREQVNSSAASSLGEREVTASQGEEPSVAARSTVMGGLVRPRKPKETAKA